MDDSLIGAPVHFDGSLSCSAAQLRCEIRQQPLETGSDTGSPAIVRRLMTWA